jgi:hypothetical protein
MNNSEILGLGSQILGMGKGPAAAAMRKTGVHAIGAGRGTLLDARLVLQLGSPT